MRKVAIVTDSIACLSPELVKQYRISIAPISLYFGDSVYQDGVDITPSEAYELFLKDPKRFTTSAPSPIVYLDAYREIAKQTKDVLCVTVSSKLSMAYQSAQIAREQAKTEFPEMMVEVMDSQTATAAEGFVALAGARAAEEGESLSEVVKVAEEIRRKIGAAVLLDTIRYVYRSGRIPKIAAQAGSILNIKPILSVVGMVRFVGVAVSREAGVNRLIGKMRDRVGRNPAHVAVMHAYAPDEAERLKERVLSEFNCVELWVSEFSPVMGYACGTGTLALAFYAESENEVV